MAIVKMQKVCVIGLDREKEEFISRLMDFGVVELTDQTAKLSDEIWAENVTDFEVDMTVNHTTEDKGGGSGAAAYEAHKHAYVGKKTFKVHNALKAGEKVLLIRVQRGKKFVVIDRVKGA